MLTNLLQEEIEELKAQLDRKGYDYRDGADAEILESLSKQGLPRAYRSFLSQLDPGDAAWRMGGQFTVVLHSSDELSDWQSEAQEADEQFIIGSLNGQPLAILKSESGEGQVFRLDEDEVVCVGSSLVQFLQILRMGLEMLSKLSDYDDEEEEDGGDEGYDDMDDYHAGAFASGREDVLNDYLEELEAIDPDCVDAWTPPD